MWWESDCPCGPEPPDHIKVKWLSYGKAARSKADVLYQDFFLMCHTFGFVKLNTTNAPITQDPAWAYTQEGASVHFFCTQVCTEARASAYFYD